MHVTIVTAVEYAVEFLSLNYGGSRQYDKIILVVCS